MLELTGDSAGAKDAKATNTDDFFIGGLISIANHALDARMRSYFPFADFPELRPIHAPIFQFLPLAGCRLTDLADQLDMTRQAAGYLVDYLVEHHYLERLPDPTDNRAQIIQRTERGWAFHRHIKPLAREVQQDWARQFGEERMRQLVLLMKQLVHDVLGVDYVGSVSEATDQQIAAGDADPSARKQP
jgi:DNA-binding MarR family transcriptional regulator